MIDGKVYRGIYDGQSVLVSAGRMKTSDGNPPERKFWTDHVEVLVGGISKLKKVGVERLVFAEPPVKRTDSELLEIARKCEADVVAFGGHLKRRSQDPMRDRKLSDGEPEIFSPGTRSPRAVRGHVYFFSIIDPAKKSIVERYGKPYTAE